MTRLLVRISAVLAAVCSVSPAASAQEFIWDNPAFSGSWSAATNWAGNSVPPSAAATALVFPEQPGYVGSYETTNNLGAFVLNRVRFTMTGQSVTLYPGTGATSLQFTADGGTEPSVVNTGTAFAQLFSSSGSGAVISNGAQLTAGAGFGSLLFSTGIGQSGSGSGRLRVASTAPSFFAAGGVVQLNAAGTFAGGTTLERGDLAVGNSAALGTGPVTVTGAENSFRFTASDLVVANGFVLNQPLVVTGGNGTSGSRVATFSGPFSGPASLTIRPTFGTYNLTGDSPLTGAFTVEPLASSTPFVALAGGGRLASVPTYTVRDRSFFQLDNGTTAVSGRLNPAAELRLTGGWFAVGGSAAAATTESVATLTTQGTANVILVPNAAQATSIRFGTWTRPNRGVGFFAADGFGGSGAGSANFFVTADPGGAVGGGGGSGTPAVSVLPYAYASTSTAGPAATLVRYDAGSQRLLPLNTVTEYSSRLAVAGPSAGVNFRRASSAASVNAGSQTVLAAPTTVNALVLDTYTNSVGASAVGASVVGPGTLTVAGGVVLSSYTTVVNTMPGQIGTAGLAFGAATGYVHTFGNLAVTAPVSGSGGLVKAGGGDLFLTAANPFTGTVTVGGPAFQGQPFGGLAVFADAALGAAGNGLYLDGGALSRLLFQVPALFTDASVTSLTVGRSVTVGETGGGVEVAGSNGTFTLSGPVGGPGSLLRRGAGVVRLTGTNTFAGPLVVGGSIVGVQDDAAMGANASAVISGGTLQPLTSFATNRNLLLNPTGGTATVFTSGGGTALTVNGLVGSPLGVGQFVKAGTGTLTLTAANPFIGVAPATGDDQSAVAVGTSIPVVRASNPAAAETGGALVLAGPSGALPAVTSFGVSPGASLVLDNSGGTAGVPNANNNRLGAASVRLRGGALTLIGSPFADVTEGIGGGTFSGLIVDRLAGTVTLTQPDSGGVGRLTRLVANSYDPSITAMTFVRGTNYGAASGDRTELRFVTQPTLRNGLIASMVLGLWDGSLPTDFATTTAVPLANGGTEYAVTRFTTYSPAANFAAGGSAAETYDLTTVVTPAGVAFNANALRLSAGGGLTLPTGTTLTLNTGSLLALVGAGAIQGGTISPNTNGENRLYFTTNGSLSVGTAANGTALTGTQGLNKFGPGTLTLYGTAGTTLSGSTTGNISVSQGTLQFGNANALSRFTLAGVSDVTAFVVVAAGATLDLSLLGSATFRTQSVTGYGTLALGSATVQTGNQAGTLVGLTGTAASQLSVGVPNAQAPSNTFTTFDQTTPSLTLAGDNTGFAGSVAVVRGGLLAATPTALGVGTSNILLGDTSGTGRAYLALGPSLTAFGRGITVQAGSSPGATTPHTLFVNPTGPMTVGSPIALGQSLAISSQTQVNGGTHVFTGAITGGASAQLRQVLGNVSYSGANTYSGGFVADAGAYNVIGLGSDSLGATSGPLGTGVVQFTTRGGALRADGGPRVLSNPIQTTGVTTNLAVVGPNDLTLAGGLTFSSLTSPLDLNAAGRGQTTFTGGLTGSQLLRKNGPGAVVLATANPGLTGGVTVNGGTLVVTNPSGSATGGGAVTVNDGGVLAGSGFVGGATTINSGGTGRAGGSEAGLEPLTFAGPLVFADGGVLRVNVGALAGRVNAGSLDLTAASRLTVHLTDVGFAGGAQTYTLIDTGATPIAYFGGSFNPANFEVVSTIPDYTATLTSLTSPTHQVVLNLVPVPEPSLVMALAAAGLLGVSRWSRRPAAPLTSSA